MALRAELKRRNVISLGCLAVDRVMRAKAGKRPGRASQIRQLFRKRMPHRVASAVAEARGDRVVPTRNCAMIGWALDYPREIDLSPPALAEAARILRDDPDTLPLLRLRIADTGTNIGQLDACLPELRHALHRIAADSP